MSDQRADGPSEQSEAAKEIGRLVTRIVKLAPVAGLHVGITIKPAALAASRLNSAKAKGEV